MSAGLPRPADGLRGRAGAPLVLALGVPAGVLAGVGLGGAAAVGLPAAVAWVLALVGEVRLFVAIIIAISGVGFYWLDGGISLAGQDLNISGLFWGVLLIVTSAVLLRKHPARLPRPLLLYGLFLALSILGLFWAPSFFEGLRHLGLYLLPFLMAAVVLAYVDDARGVRFLIGSFWLAMILAVLVAIGMSVARWSAGEGGPLAGGVGDRTLAIFLLPMLALALAGARHRSRWFVWVAVAIGLVGLATLSRTAVAVMLALAFLAGLGVSPLKRLAILLLIVVLGVGALRVEAFRERFGSGRLNMTEVRVEGTGRGAALSAGGLDLSGRGWMWLQVAAHAIERPVLGHGTGSSTVFMIQLPSTPADHPHNDYLRVFHDLGAVGLLVVLAFGGGTWWYFRRLYLEARTPLSRELALASYLATAGFGAIAVTDNPAIYATFFTQNVFILYALTEIAVREEGRATPGPFERAVPAHA